MKRFAGDARYTLYALVAATAFMMVVPAMAKAAGRPTTHALSKKMKSTAGGCSLMGLEAVELPQGQQTITVYTQAFGGVCPSTHFVCDDPPLCYSHSEADIPYGAPDSFIVKVADMDGNTVYETTIVPTPTIFASYGNGQPIHPPKPPPVETPYTEVSVNVSALTAAGPTTVYFSTEICPSPGSCSSQRIVAGAYPPPEDRQFTFEFSSNDPAQRVLVHKFETSDSFPLGNRQLPVPPADPAQVRIKGVVTADGAGAARDVYFRLVDPPDTSPYVPAGDRKFGDNLDRANPKGHLYVQDINGNFVIDPNTGQRMISDANGRLKVRSRNDGGVTLVLETSNYAAGDNYQIEASFDPQNDFDRLAPDQPCVDCKKSNVYVLWKRVYLEQDAMLRRGAFISTPASPGATGVDVADVRPFRAGEDVILIHADGSAGPRYSEVHRIGTVVPDHGARTGRIEFQQGDSLQHAFSGPRPNGLGPTIPYLADGVGVYTGNSAADAFVVDTSKIADLFEPAFVDYQILTASRNRMPFMPYVEFSDRETDQLQLLTRQWCETASLPNHQYLVGAAVNRDYAQAETLERGLTVAANDLSYSYILMRRIGRGNELAEIVDHEIAHQWHVNPRHINPSGSTSTEHDAYLQWNSPSSPRRYCQMTEAIDCLQGCSDATDGRVAFHFQKLSDGVDSEYFWIRQRCDAVPREPRQLTSQTWWSSTTQCQ